MNIPNILTLLRIFLIPVFVVCYYLPFASGPIIAAMVFIVAGVTDWLDGYLARKLHQASKFGAFLDPVADKLMVAVALVLMVSNPHLNYIAIPSAVIIGREIAISALREWMAELGKRANVAVGFVGKLKTAMQLAAIPILVGAIAIQAEWFRWAGYILLYVSAILTLWSMCVYLAAAWPDFDFMTVDDEENNKDPS
ncbi:MAG: CDP-diacylglycerol--glycerol-3-phosphate 3-phosphatidyltransferase [Gammaproteobacteria bacterium CG11_big_fil_rev_8_21_14_0_20_46_22]|nr:MAG: CDP-diacylglycerol--glycerol-3-phosphate 3-phosphatidyltransferase [Gammaproteobacteria bacterium CG12_big_fil_rev_8_21_14_0_65_46_12]PIR10629.1 MAG: CDP-diacylglycerol--glycerol-3-phosphate 3-phosphatidyltransferase [Gammaproteobacteria bacterium CG11_big_fil_rev_8_21_14_0_20_46_22]